jgi:triphosphoribosyl-dephospho-CoA synthase
VTAPGRADAIGSPARQEWASSYIASAAQLACLLEASAPKPGNVSPGRPFSDASYEDFLASASALGPVLMEAGTRPLGESIRSAVTASSAWARSNTNLGIVLLLTPLAKAASLAWTRAVANGVVAPGTLHGSGICDAAALRQALRHVVDATTVEDAREAYAAIRDATPGGLGRVDSQDVAGEPTVSLREAMRLAADRDGVAREYATAFETTFERGVPALRRARADGLTWNEAVVETFLTLLAAGPDTHIARRAGARRADEVSARAAGALADGGVRTAAGRRTIDDMDRALRDAANSANPGTTADLTAAALFVALLAGEWRAAGHAR